MGNSNTNPIAGVVGFFEGPEEILAAARRVRASQFKDWDCYTPFPVHGMDEAQGLKRSLLPFVTLAAGLTGFLFAFGLQYWTSAVDWPINVAGKPFNSWPAFVPVMFELTVLFAGLSTVGAMFVINGLPNLTKRTPDLGITNNKFAIMIDAPRASHEEHPDDAPKLDEQKAAEFLKTIGAKDVRSVAAEGWF